MVFVVDILPTTSAVFDANMTALVVLNENHKSRSLDSAPISTSTPAQLSFVVDEAPSGPTPSPPNTIKVSSAVRAMLDGVTRSETLLCFGVPVTVSVVGHLSEALDTIYTITAYSRELMNEISNASLFHASRVQKDWTSPSLCFSFIDNDVHKLVSNIFLPLPTLSRQTTIVAVKVAPVLPFSYRKIFINEERIWSGLRAWLARDNHRPVWLREGQLIRIDGSWLDDDSSDPEEQVEQMLLDVAPRAAGMRSKDITPECSPSDRVAYCEVLSMVMENDSSVPSAMYAAGYYDSTFTKLEVADASDGDGIIQFPPCGDMDTVGITKLGGAKALVNALQQCLTFQDSHEEGMNEEDLSMDSLPPLQSVVVYGDEANIPFEITKTVICQQMRLPYTIYECRLKQTATLPSLISEGCYIERSLTAAVDSKKERIPIRRPLVLIVRHAELLEEAELASAERALARGKGYLIVVFCHEREGSSKGTGTATNASDGNGANVSGAAQLSCSLASTLTASIACGVPSEADRLALLTELFASSNWLCSITLSPSLVASWTVGFTVMDIIAYANAVVATAMARYRQILQCNPSIQIVLSDEDFREGLSEYQQTHGLIVSSTKLQPVKWSDVGGLHEAKKEILETIQLPTKFPHLFKTGGMQRKMGILLFGPPGCGKTLLAKAVATEMNMNFLSVKGPELINQYVGESEKNVRDIFQRARDNAPCVLFFDELDALAPARGAKGDAGGAMDRIVSQLLVEMDGVDKGEGDVFIVAATNRPDMLDAALLRPGRFDQRCYLGPPETAEEKALALKALTRKFKLAEEVDLTDISERLQATAKYTGADLFALCSDAMLFAVEERVAELKAAHAEGREVAEEEDMKVQKDHFERALAQLQPSVTAEEFAKYERLRSNIVR